MPNYLTIDRVTKAVRKASGQNQFSMFKAEGYFVMVFDHSGSLFDIYETESVYTMYLSNMALDQWVEAGVDFVEKVKRQHHLV